MLCARPRARRGFTLIELLVAVVLAAWLGAAALRGYAALRTAGERTRVVSSATQARRMVRTVLRSELGTGVSGVDWTAHSPDSIRLRAFRATAIPCGPAGEPMMVVGDSTIVVGLVGARVPDPSKDSLLVMTVEGTWEVVDLVARASGACASFGVDLWPDSRMDVERWTLRPMPALPVFLRLFESGSYHLGDQALRYRRGAGGRQPLTEAVLGSAVFVDSGGVVRADSGPEGAPNSQAVLARPR